MPDNSPHARWDIPASEPSRPIAPRASVQARRITERPTAPGPLVWVSTHGGAGSTSIARSSGLGLALSGAWPAPELGWPSRVVLLGRSNATGLDAVGLFLQQWASREVDDVTVTGVVIVADAPGRTPKSLRERITALRSITPNIYQLPWIEDWRLNPGSPDNRANTIAQNALTTERN